MAPLFLNDQHFNFNTVTRSNSMSLLGDDGLGYELARKLEESCVWRSWLGDNYYSTFIHSLASLSSWDSFIRVDDSKSKSHIHLQLRARALLYDKAAISLFLPSAPTSSSVSVSNLNVDYFKLNGSDLYFTLENGSKDGVQPASFKSQFKSAYVGSRYGESDFFDNLSQRYKNEELPETWYDQFIEKYKLNRPYKLSYGDRESDKRTPEDMSAYVRIREKNKRRHVAIQENQYTGFGNSVLENTSSVHPNSVLEFSNSADSDIFFPETMFTLNCVPDTANPPITRVNINPKVEFKGVLDTLPPVMVKSPGIRTDRLGIEQGGSLHHGKNGSERNKKCLGEEQASQISQKVTAHILTGVGFEGATEVPLEVFSQLLSRNIYKLGSKFNVLAASYTDQCSAIEIFKMFLQAAEISNIGSLAELVKDSTRTTVQPTQEQVHGLQLQQQSSIRQPTLEQVHGMQLQQQSSIRIPQQLQMQRQMHQQLAFQQMQQQQSERMHRGQPSAPRPGMDLDKEQAMLQVNMENRSELPMDPVNAINTRPSQTQFRQQQLNAVSTFHAQSNNQFRSSMSVQIPQMHTPPMGVVRAPPVKVDGFQELMGGDASSKHDSEENKLTSPGK
ncbi:hypothetical protein Ddye_010172 [Dipteronia dyeriana]|uniref:Uncharacterized protein n=1 Tax=Dipteronia dyeriana TaxID=168575 RepID=A0AAD9XCS2_9ROSI|nr:hypothetical protein Ddye_010172 [Dipteronia dyeriana]